LIEAVIKPQRKRKEIAGMTVVRMGESRRKQKGLDSIDDAKRKRQKFYEKKHGLID